MNNKKAADMLGGTTRRWCFCQTLQTNIDALLSAFTLEMLWFFAEFRRNKFKSRCEWVDWREFPVRERGPEHHALWKSSYTLKRFFWYQFRQKRFKETKRRCSSICCTCCWLSGCHRPPRRFLDISSSCPLRRCLSWKCLASLLPWLRRWLLPRSAGSSRFRTSCCLRWSPAPPGDGSRGTFSVTKKRTTIMKRCRHLLHQEVLDVSMETVPSCFLLTFIQKTPKEQNKP